MNAPCPCRADFTCGYHLAEFFREQGFSGEEACDLVAFELAEPLAAWWLYR